MDKRKEAKSNLEGIVASDSAYLGGGANSTFEDDMNEMKLFEARCKQIHQIETDELDEELKRAEIRKRKFDLEEARRKSARDEEEFKLKVEREEREAADREAKAIEKAKLEAKEKKSEKKWKFVDLGLKIGGILIPVIMSGVMFFCSMKMEYVDDKIPNKTMKDLLFKSIKH